MRASAACTGSLGPPVPWRRRPGLEDQDVLAHAQRAHQHHALDDLAGARVDDRLAVGPAARGAVDPVDHIVAHVQRIDALGQDFTWKASM